MRFFPQSHTFLYGLHNLTESSLEVTLDICAKHSKNLFHSFMLASNREATTVTKVVGPKLFQFLFYSEAQPDAEMVARKVEVVKCTKIN